MLRKVIFLLFAIAIQGVLFTNGCDDEGDKGTVIAGNVVDSLTGAPIDSAVIHLEDTTRPSVTLSDSVGYYALAPFGIRRFTVFCSKSGYKTKTHIIHSTDEENIFENVDFEMAQ